MNLGKELKEALYFAFSIEFLRMGVVWTVALLYSYWQLVAQRFFGRISNTYTRCTPRTTGLTRPVCIITGATSGLGAAAASALSREGFYVVLAGRSSRLLSETMMAIFSQNQDAHLKAFQVDLTSLRSILKFKDSLEQWLLDSNMHSSIQLLINDAGILAASSRVTTEGYDEMLCTNYIGPFFLTKALLPLLKNSPVPSRIMNVTSFTHRNVLAPQFDIETVTGKNLLRSQQYQFGHVYEYSKCKPSVMFLRLFYISIPLIFSFDVIVCIVLFTYELHRRLVLMDKSRHVSVVAVDPGFVKTKIMREFPSLLTQVAFMAFKVLGLLQSPEEGISSILDGALAPPETSGVYFFGGKGRTIKSSVFSQNSKFAEELWTTSNEIYLNWHHASKSS